MVREGRAGCVRPVLRIGTGLAIPAKSGHGEAAREAFLYLLAFTTLSIATWGWVSLVFDLLDEWLPESVVQSPNVMYAFGPNLQTSMAQLLTAFPAFLWVMRLIGKGESEAGSRSATAVTRWLTYISLFLTATTAICDLMVAVEYALRGELTVRFVLKVLTVLVAAGGVFLYFFEPLRTAPVSRLVWARPLSALAVVLALAAFGGGLAAAGSPSTHRKVEADRRRVQDLTAVAVRWIFRN